MAWTNYAKMLVVIVLLIPPCISRPEALAEDEEAMEAKESGSLSIIPMFGYSPETKLLGGAMGLYTFRISDGRGRHSSILLSGLYTQNKQYSVSLTPELYLGGGRYLLRSTGIGLLSYPEMFYGVGNDTSHDAEESFTYQARYVRASLQKRVFADVV